MLLNLLTPKQPRILGIDLSTTSIKLVELSQKSHSLCMESYAIEPIPTQAMEGATIQDIESVGGAISRAIKRARSGAKFGAIAVQASATITKIIKMSKILTDNEIYNEIIFDAERYIPYPLEEVNWDFYVLGTNAKNPELRDILLAASRTENVAARIDALALAGLSPKVIDIEAYAIERAYSLIAEQLPDQGQEQTVAIMDIGAMVTNLSVLHDGNTVYSREQLFGGKMLTDQIKSRYGMSYEEANLAKHEGGLPADYETQILQPFKANIEQQVSRSLQFFFSSSEFREIDYLVLAGGTAVLEGLPQLLEQKLKVPTIVANPFARMRIAPNIDVSALNTDAPALMISCGLAMRSFGG